MADGKSAPTTSATPNIPNIQHELLECINIVKSKITEVLKIMKDYINEHADTVDIEKLEVLLRKLKMVALLSIGVQDYIF